MARRWKVLLVTSVAVFMSFLDVTIVNIAFPDIRASFPRTSLSGLSWILNAYTIVFAAALVPAGRLAARFGRRRFFFLGVAVFLGASVVCGAAGSVGVMIAARAVQALGGAMLVPASLGLLLPEFPLARRATATALRGGDGSDRRRGRSLARRPARRLAGLARGLLREPADRPARAAPGSAAAAREARG